MKFITSNVLRNINLFTAVLHTALFIKEPTIDSIVFATLGYGFAYLFHKYGSK